MSAVLIRSMTSGDWLRVEAIYAEGIATGQATFETEVPSREAWEAKHHAHSRLIAERDGIVVGWGTLAPVSVRRAYAGVAEVSVYVAAEARGGGVGGALLAAIIQSSEQNGIWTLQSSIFPENEASLRLQQRHGFRIVGRRERIARHHGAWRDTLILERRSGVVGTTTVRA